MVGPSQLLIKVLDFYRRVVGEEHPDRLKWMNNLIELYGARGKPEKAEELRARLPRKKSTKEQ